MKVLIISTKKRAFLNPNEKTTYVYRSRIKSIANIEAMMTTQDLDQTQIRDYLMEISKTGEE